ncbi:MAG TPA: YrdB family protein [Mycobacteriales bacterium]|nr:YrdB family protein [Mycobacteriales bacterium]
MVKPANQLLMFLLELAVYVSVAVWAVTLGSGTALHVILAIVAVGVWAGVWAILGAPKAKKFRLHGAGRVVLEILWFGGAIALLGVAGHPVLAAVFGGLYLLNAAGRAFFDRSVPRLSGTERPEKGQ